MKTFEQYLHDINALDPDFEVPEPWVKQGDYIPSKSAKTEADLQAQVAKYLSLCYPQVVFHHDAHAAVQVHISKAQQAKAAGTCKGWPDLAIMLPRGPYAGLFLELKKPGLRLFKVKSGEPYNSHFATQLALHKKLETAGYSCHVVQTLQDAKFEIDKYMKA